MTEREMIRSDVRQLARDVAFVLNRIGCDDEREELQEVFESALNDELFTGSVSRRERADVVRLPMAEVIYLESRRGSVKV